ncbi:hypothetical protein EG329_008495 [Mollisiaceae sp. DMI_Dod_QoI]|nr:hypothetical protein EG329_008495 [Helotiales sp. DMI_Dod_QoI]
MDTNATTGATHTTNTKSTPSKLIQINLNTPALTSLATSYLQPENLTPFLQEHKSGIIVATLWLTLHLRTWLSLLPLPLPTLTTLPLIILSLLSLSLSQSTSTPTLPGLLAYTYTSITTSLTLLTQEKILPAYFPRLLPILILFPLSRALALLSLFLAWTLVSKYHAGVLALNAAASQAIQHAEKALEKAHEQLREAKGWEMQAMQLAAAVLDDEDEDEDKKRKVGVVREVRGEVEGMMKEVEGLEGKVEKVRGLVGRAKGVAGGGDLELAGEMVGNVGRLVERVGQGGERVRERGGLVRERVWKLGLGEGEG